MAFVAKNCFYTPWSHWVDHWIQGCNGEFAAGYKKAIYARERGRRQRRRSRPWEPKGVVLGYYPTVTCYYPNAPANYYDIATSFAEPGQFVWEYLGISGPHGHGQIQPYRLIADPCPAGPCGQQNACCGTVDIPGTLYVTLPGGGTVVLEYSASGGQWQNGAVTYAFTCIPNVIGGGGIWTLTIPAVGALDAAAVVCLPFAATFTNGSSTWTVTS